MREAELQDAVVECARVLGWRAAHFRPARTARGWRTPMQGDTGFPDLVLARDGRVVFAELKSDSGRLGDDQRLWLAELGGGAAESYCWRPRDWTSGLVERVLR